MPLRGKNRKNRQMGFHNIWQHNGLGIAATGMIIVFAALTFISIFIYLLPGILKASSFIVPQDSEPLDAQTAQTTDGDELVAAMGFVLHQIELGKNQRE